MSRRRRRPPWRGGVLLVLGLLGWLRFLPLGHHAWPEAGALMMVLGIVAMFMGVLFGLGQRDAKVVLAIRIVRREGIE